MLSRRRALALLMATGSAWGARMGAAGEAAVVEPDRLLLSDFQGEGEVVAPGMRWRGFSDRVMGGVSDAQFARAEVAGKRCVRLTGRVTRDNGGGFIQMALDMGPRGAGFDGSAFAGVEFLVHGNDEDYNVHVRTEDCGWYDESYRATVRLGPRWQRIRIAWTEFRPNGELPALDASRLQRIALLGWMREFEADIALAELALYR